MTTRVFVSGCFDMLHSGHIEFLQRAAAQGDDLYVALGSDRTVFELKGTPPVNHEQERCFMVQSVGCVQPFVSKHYPGSVITLSIDPTVAFNERSGMANSTRRTAIELWGPKLPVGDPAKLAKILFCCDNPPGTTEVSGTQDAIGLVFPGLARSDYAGEY